MATMNLTTGPYLLSPANNEIWFVYNSGSSSLTDFRYFFTINAEVEPFSTNTKRALQTYKLPPRPVVGDAQYSPHRILKSLFTYDLNPFSTGWITASNALVEFNLGYGFEYNPNVTFSTIYNASGFMALTTLFSTPEFNVGDIITVSKENKQVNIEYDGTCSVVSKPLNAALVTDKPFGVTTSIVETGNIINLSRKVGTSSNYLAYNGTRQYLERTQNFTDTFLITATSTNYPLFLTDYRETSKKIYLKEYETLSMILGTTSGYDFIIEMYNSSSTLISGTAIPISATNKYQRMDFGVGTQNILQLAGNSQSYFTNVDNYSCWVEWRDAIEIEYVALPSFKTEYETLYPVGTSNGRNYYVWTDIYRTYYLSWSSANSQWEINSALGGGNQWLVSATAGANNLPTVGSRPTEWIDGQDAPLFTTFILDTGARVSEIKNYKIKTNCSVYEPVRICFLNREGGWDYFTFTKDTKKTTEIQRTQYTKQLAYNYNVGDRGDTIISQKAKETYLVNSDWITEPEAIWLEQLFTSPEVYHLTADGEKLPIIITDNTYQTQTYLRNQIFNIQINYRYSYNINLQSE